MRYIYYLRSLLLGLLIYVMVVSLCGCTVEPPFRQPVEAIAKIELIENAASEESVLCTLTDNDANVFMAELLTLPCYKRMPPVGELGQYEIRIYYINGDADFIGSEANAYIQDGDLVVDGWYYFDQEDLCSLFATYMPS